MARRPTVAARILATALPAAVPGLVVVAGLAGAGVIGPAPALVSAAILGLVAIIVGARLGPAISALAAAVDEFAPTPDAGAALPLRAAPALDAIRLAIQRLGRGSRERLGDTEARLAAAEAIVAAVPDPLILLDERRRIVRANTAAAALVGAPSLPCDLASALRNPAVLAAADLVLRGESARTVDFTLAVPVERHLRARFARIERRSPEGAVVLISLYDVTELRRTEQMRADFIANASHELRTPLATLTGFIETLRGPARDDAKARDRFLAIMNGEAMRMTRLVQDLLSLSRIELNEHVPPQGRVALAPLLRQLAEALELRAGERGMRIALALPPDLPDVQGDRDELAQVFQNLLDNAIKYGRGGTEITVDGAAARRQASGERGAADFVAVAVTDRGEGIAREHLPRLTERFYRVDTARSRELGGTGLGLAIVKHIINRHRGLLEIDSTPGEGSVFTVLLRAERTPAAAAADASGRGPPS